jgi:serine/threonine protein kinase/class 3 adenylate cyclase
MDIGNYRFLAQLGAGPNGVAYRAEVRTSAMPVELRVLSLDPEQREALLRRLRLVALLDAPAALRLIESKLDHEPPYVVLSWSEPAVPGGALASAVPLPVLLAVTRARAIAVALAAAHRLGLTHGSLEPGSLRAVAGSTPKFDFTGLDVQGPPPAGPWQELARACRAPEGPGVLAGAADVYSLGVLLHWLLTGACGAAADRAGLDAALANLPAAAAQLVRELLAAMLQSEPAERPSAEEVAHRLEKVLQPEEQLAGTLLSEVACNQVVQSDQALTCATPAVVSGDSYLASLGEPPSSATPVIQPRRLGRFQLTELLGQGGMGAVYRATDDADGSVVAIKVLRPELTGRGQALRRFHKEARLLAEVNNPFVTNLLEVNQDGGTHYLVMEFVAGLSLGELLKQRGRLPEKEALEILAGVARGLAAAHERGIVHRDVKPQNILLTRAADAQPFHAKLSDFGLARHVIESESLELTRHGALLGTPLYMAPEQVGGGKIGPTVDVYALGATLYHVLTGQPPFSGPDALSLIKKHATEALQPLQKLNPELSEGVCRVVEKALAKSPDERYADAGTFLSDLDRLLRGEPTGIAVHPRLPAGASVVAYDFTWELEASPRELWPHVSNTERLNRAIGLGAVQFTEQAPAEAGDPARRFGVFSKLGLTAAWQEHPFEWIEGRRMGVLREYSAGPFVWFVSIVELAPRGAGGSTLTHRLRLEPRGLLGRTVAAVEAGIRGKRSLERVYRRIDAFLTGKLGSRALADPFEDPPALPAEQKRRLDLLLERLCTLGAEPAVVERLGEFLAHAPAQEVARIRPLALARRLGLEPQAVVTACLHGAREGLLLLLWDILCPVCRIPSEVKETLRAVREHGRCDACHLDFELDFANSVEMIFRAHPEVRATDLGTYCIGGPAHSPHVAAQVRLAPGERTELELALAEGSYRLRGPQLPYSVDFRVQPSAPLARWELDLLHGPDSDTPRILRAGRQALVLHNRAAREVVVRIERTARREDALTAARAASLALFRELFPGEVLAPGQLVNVATITLLITELDGAAELYAELGDARAFTLLHEHFRLVADALDQAGGALVKTVGEGVLAVFSDSAGAVIAALALQPLLAAHEKTRRLRLRVAIHRGPALAATLNDHLDYFGTTVRQALQLPAFAGGGAVVLSAAVCADPAVAALLAERGLTGALVDTDLPCAPLLLIQG